MWLYARGEVSPVQVCDQLSGRYPQRGLYQGAVVKSLLLVLASVPALLLTIVASVPALLLTIVASVPAVLTASQAAPS